MPITATIQEDKIIPILKKLKPKDTCPYCFGTYYLIFPDGKHCIRCKHFFSNKTPIIH
jgi:hypothetical protein